jgi:hypothetical protein
MTANATNIDRYLRTGHSVRQIAKFFDIPESQVQFRADRVKLIDERRTANLHEAAHRKRTEAAALGHAEQMRRTGLSEWLALDLTYEDHPMSAPFDYSRAFANTVALSRNPEADRTLGGVVQYGNREAA